MAMKFTDFSFGKNSLKFILIILAVLAIIFMQWLAVPVIFILYVIVSLISEPAGFEVKSETTETKDITV